MIPFFSSYMPKISQFTYNPRSFLMKDALFQLIELHDVAVEKTEDSKLM